MKKYLLLTYFLFTGLFLSAQIGGTKVYEFLNLPQSARVTALGGYLFSVVDEDVNLAYSNPAALNPMMSGGISFNHNFQLLDLNNGHVAYAKYVNKWDMTLHGNVQYMGYGDFNATDEFGNINGQFQAKEYAMTVGAGKQLYEKLSVGVNLRLISSRLETYNSLGWTGDIAAMYQDTASRFSAALVFKNIGSQLTAYTEGRFESIPYNAHLSVTKRLRHLPLRFSLIYSNLNRWNVLYDDPNAEDGTLFLGSEEPTESKFGIWADNFARHFTFNTELLLGKNDGFKIRFGYNHLRKKELSVNSFRSLTGFSLGFGMKVKRFRFDYGHAFYHLAGGSNHLTLSFALEEFTKKRIIK